MNRQQIFLYTFLGSPKGPILVEKRFNFRFVQGALLGCIFRFVSYHFFEPFPIRIKPLLSRLMAVLYSFQVVLFQYLFLNLFRFVQGASLGYISYHSLTANKPVYMFIILGFSRLSNYKKRLIFNGFSCNLFATFVLIATFL